MTLQSVQERLGTRMNKLLFRVDGNAFLGAGHVMRCLSLATALKKEGCECTFVVSEDSSVDMIRTRGFSVHNLHSMWNDYGQSLDELIEVVKQEQPSVVVVDSYYADASFLEKLKLHVKTAVIAEKSPVDFKAPVDYFINYNIFMNGVVARPAHLGTLLLGSRYALLREEFATEPVWTEKRLENIVILTGGSDPHNIALDVCESILCDTRFEALGMCVISGPMNPHIRELEALSRSNPRVRVEHAPKSVRSVIDQCDIAISAGGSTLYELCAGAVPTISFSYVDNQLDIVKGFDAMHLIPYAGDIRTGKEETLLRMLNHLETFIQNEGLWMQRRLSMREVCDGNGAQRVAKVLLDVDRVGTESKTSY